jgi:hypothetical protein
MDPKTNGQQKTDEVQGEGNYDATRNYDNGVEQTVRSGKVDELVKKAEKALEGPEGEELRKAEEEGKRGEPKPAQK